MQDLRLLVEHRADAVAAVLADHRVAQLLGMFLDHFADVAQARARPDQLDALVHAFLGHAAELVGPFRDLAHGEHLAGVAVVAVLDHRHIDVEDVAILERLVIGDAMADHVVDRGADRLGEALVVEGRGNGLLHVDDVVVADAVQFLGGHAGFDMLADHLQHFGGQAAGNAHLVDFGGRLDGDGHIGSQAQTEKEVS
ncbi:hypothetical protein D9M69_519500 [compost metagenome]